MKGKFINIFVFILIYISIDTLLFGTNSNSALVGLQYPLIIILSIILTIITIINKKRINKKILKIFGIFMAITIGTFLLNFKINFKYIYEIFIVYIAILFSINFSFESFKKSFVNNMFLLSSFSLITYFMTIINCSIISKFPNITNISGIKFYNLFLSNIPSYDLGYKSARNFGIFREPGVYSIFVLIALMFVLFQTKKEKEKDEESEIIKTIKIIIFSLTILSTFSTAGIICLGLSLAIYSVSSMKINTRKIILIYCFLAGFGLLFLTGNFSQRILEKLTSPNASLFSRTNSFTSNIVIGITNPVFGVGWENVKEEFDDISYKINGAPTKFGEETFHNTNTFLKFLAVHGIIIFVLYVCGFLKTLYKTSNNIIITGLLFIVIFFAFANEDLTINILFHLLMMYGYIEDKEEERRLNEGC